MVTAVNSTQANRGAAADGRGSGPQVGGSSADIAQRPNIILITTDDQSVADMRVMQDVLQRLGGRGTTFTRAFSPYPQCCPARATILTGQYAHNHHVLGNKPPWGGFQAFDDSRALPLWLQQAGYHTALLGKYLNGYPDPADREYVPPGWDTWRAPVAGIYNYRHWTMNQDGRLVDYRGQYQTNFVGDQARSLINKYAPSRDPFFLWAGFLAPHIGHPIESDDPIARFGPGTVGTPALAPPYRDALKGLSLPAKASINEADVSDKPLFISTAPKLRRAALTEANQQRRESLLFVDDAVDEMLDTLSDQGELNNTVIIFTSDNGFLVGEHRRTGKVIGYEESTRVPLIIAGPGFNTGQRRAQKVSLADLAPTIAQIAGATPQVLQDGRPLRPIAARPDAVDRRPILFQAGPRAHQLTRWYTAIRTKTHVYVEYDTGETELYDLRTDPLQLTNLAADPGSAKTVRTLARALDVLRNCAGPTCRESVQTLVHGRTPGLVSERR